MMGLVSRPWSARMLPASVVMTLVAWMIARNDDPCGGFSSARSKLGEGDAMFEEDATLDRSECRVVGDSSGLLDGDAWTDLADKVSRRSSGGSTPLTSVTDMLRRLREARALDEDDGLRIEKPSVPKTLRDVFRFAGAAFVGVAGTDCVEGTSSLVEVIDEVSFTDSTLSLSRGKGTRGALLLLLGLTHHEPIQSPNDGLSPFTVSLAEASLS